MCYAYILQSQTTKRFYIGSTNNLDRRLAEHNANKTRSLKKKGPFKVVYKEFFNNKSEATKREFLIKSYKGGNEFKKLVCIS